jgi:hypothetical protein
MNIEDLENYPLEDLKSEIIETLSGDVTNEFLAVLVRVIEMELEENFADIFSVDYYKGESTYDNLCKVADAEDLRFLTSSNVELLKGTYGVESLEVLKEGHDDVFDVLNTITNTCGEQAYYSFIGNLMNNKRCKDIISDGIKSGYLDE